jgi:hypothetical protein
MALRIGPETGAPAGSSYTAVRAGRVGPPIPQFLGSEHGVRLPASKAADNVGCEPAPGATALVGFGGAGMTLSFAATEQALRGVHWYVSHSARSRVT